METRYHIGLLTGTLLILAILSYAYYADYNYRKEIARTEQTEQQETEQTVSTQGGAHKEGVYYLKNRNGYVIVYLDDQTSIYEYTNIRVEELPEELQNEIREGRRDKRKMETAKIERINELYRKSKAEGLTEKEKKEQQILRREYVDAFKRNLRGQLNNISIKEKDGSITNLGEKYGQKKGN